MQVLPVSCYFNSRGIQIQALCPVCSQTMETIVHLFWECDIAKQCWQRVELWWNIHIRDVRVQHDLFKTIFLSQNSLPHTKSWKVMVAVNCWLIWKVTNEKVFKNKNFITNSFKIGLKTESLSYCVNNNIVLKANSSLWYVDPHEAVSNTLIRRKSKLL